eukprot:2649924-Ditylum_brightwellii.AAC.1
MDILEEFEAQQAEQEEEPHKKRRRAARTSCKIVQTLPVIRRPGCEFCKFTWKSKKYHGKETVTSDKYMKRATLGCLH